MKVLETLDNNLELVEKIQGDRLFLIVQEVGNPLKAYSVMYVEDVADYEERKTKARTKGIEASSSIKNNENVVDHKTIGVEAYKV